MHRWVLTAEPFKFTTRPRSTQRSIHQSTWFSKVHNSVELDVCLSEWDDARRVTYARDTLDRNRKFSEIKRSKMLKLIYNLRCGSNFAKRALLLDSSHQNSRPCFTKVGDFIGEFYQQIKILSPCHASSGKDRAIISMEHISLCTCIVISKCVDKVLPKCSC